MYLPHSGERTKELSNVRFLHAIHLHIGTWLPLEVNFKRNETEILYVYRSFRRSFLSHFVVSHGIFQRGQPQLLRQWYLCQPPTAHGFQSTAIPQSWFTQLSSPQTSALVSGPSPTQLRLLPLSHTRYAPMIQKQWRKYLRMISLEQNYFKENILKKEIEQLTCLDSFTWTREGPASLYFLYRISCFDTLCL